MPYSIASWVLALAAFAGPAWSGDESPRLLVELRIRVAGGPEVRIVEPDGGLATITPKGGPFLGLTPVVSGRGRQRVKLTVFDLRPSGRPGKVAIEDLDLSLNVVGTTARTAPRLDITLLAIRDPAK